MNLHDCRDVVREEIDGSNPPVIRRRNVARVMNGSSRHDCDQMKSKDMIYLLDDWIISVIEVAWIFAVEFCEEIITFW